MMGLNPYCVFKKFLLYLVTWTVFSVYRFLLCFNLCWKLLSHENPLDTIWNPKSSFENWKSNLNLISFFLPENLFQTWTLRSGAMWVYYSLSCGRVKYMQIAPLSRVHVWNRFSDRTNFRFKFWLIFMTLTQKKGNI